MGLGFARLLHGRQATGLKDAIFTSNGAMGFIDNRNPLLHIRRLNFWSPCSVCSSCSRGSIQLILSRSVSGSTPRRVMQKEAYGFGEIRNDPERVRVRVSRKMEFYVEPVDDDNNLFSNVRDTTTTANDVEKVSKILINESNATAAIFGQALDQCGVTVSPLLVVEVLRKLSNVGVLALEFFRWAERREGFEHTTECYYHLFEALGKIKQFKLIWSLVEVMGDRGLLTKEIFGLISRRYARAKMVDEAIRTFEKMEIYGLVPEQSDFNHLIDTISKSKNVKIAQGLVQEKKKKKMFLPDLKTYTILIEGWGQQLNMSRLVEVYKEMLSEGFKPDLVTYGILINAFCKARKLEEAVNIFNEMEARNIKPSAHIYCNLINGLGADKRLNDAAKYFKKFNDSGFAPDLPTYNAMMGAYCWAQRFDLAYVKLDEMKRSGITPNCRTYDVILNHLIRAKKTEEAYHLFRRMEGEDGCKPELNTYTMIVRMLCAVERLDVALKVWKQMIARGILPCLHMFMVLINRLCCDNRLDEACEYMEEMFDRGIRPPGQLYNNLIQALKDGRRNDLVIKLGLKLDKIRNSPLAA